MNTLAFFQGGLTALILALTHIRWMEGQLLEAWRNAGEARADYDRACMRLYQNIVWEAPRNMADDPKETYVEDDPARTRVDIRL